MRKMLRKVLCVTLAVLMVAGLSVTAWADDAMPGATPVGSSNYSVTFQNNKMIFKQGKQTYTYNIKNTDVALTTDPHDCLIICYYDKDGAYLEMSLESQTTLSIYGSMTRLMLNPNLAKNITINLYANTTTLDIENAGTVNIFGTVTTSEVNGASTINVKNGGIVTTQKLRNSSAAISVEKGGVIKKSENVAEPKPAPTKSTYSLSVRKIYAEEGSTLGDLRNKLNNNITATDTRTQKEIFGTATWTKSKDTDIYEDGKYTFTFTPDDSKYEPMKGNIAICVDEVHGNVTLRYNNKSIFTTSEKMLGELQDDLNAAVYAVDSRGNYVPGTFVWDDGYYTTPQSKRAYKFTFIPNSSNFRRATGSMTIEVTVVPPDYDPDIDGQSDAE